MIRRSKLWVGAVVAIAAIAGACAVQLAPARVPAYFEMVPDVARYFVASDHADALVKDFPERQDILAYLVGAATTAVNLGDFARESCMQSPDREQLAAAGFDPAGPMAAYPIDDHTIGLTVPARDGAAAATFLRSQISAHSLYLDPPAGPEPVVMKYDEVALTNARLCNGGTPVAPAADDVIDPRRLALYPAGPGQFGVKVRCHAEYDDGARADCTCSIDHKWPCDGTPAVSPIAVSPKAGEFHLLTNLRPGLSAWYTDVGDGRGLVIIRRMGSADPQPQPRGTVDENVDPILRRIALSLQGNDGARFSHDDTFSLLQTRLSVSDGADDGHMFGVVPGDDLLTTAFLASFTKDGARIAGLTPMGGGFAVGNALMVTPPVEPAGAQPQFSSLARGEVADRALSFYLAYFRAFRPNAFRNAKAQVPPFLAAAEDAVERSNAFYSAGAFVVNGQDGLPGLVIRLDARPQASHDSDPIKDAMQFVADKLTQLEAVNTMQLILRDKVPNAGAVCDDAVTLRGLLPAGWQPLFDSYVDHAGPEADPDYPFCDESIDLRLRPGPGAPVGLATLEEVDKQSASGGQIYLLSPPPYQEEIDALNKRSDAAGFDLDGLKAGKYRAAALRVGDTVYFADRASLFQGPIADTSTWQDRAPFSAKAWADTQPSVVARQISYYPAELFSRYSLEDAIDGVTEQLSPYRLVSAQIIPDPAVNAISSTAIIARNPVATAGAEP